MVAYTSIKRRKFDRDYGVRTMGTMTRAEFQSMFRMSHQSFEKLEALIVPHFEGLDVEQARRGSGSAISVKTRLACTLRYLAGGSYHDIAQLFGVSSTNFFNQKTGVLWRTVDALDSALELYFDDDEAALQAAAAEFAAFSHGRMTGCVMAVDGLVVKTRKPTLQEVPAVSYFRNRKGCWGLVCLAGCDANLRFTMMKPNNSGGTNDVTAWNLSRMKAYLEEGRLPAPYYLVGDEAFVNTNQFLTPWSGKNLELDQDSFNFHLSSMRQCIERAFGMLVGRWGIFWRPFKMAFRRWCTVIMVCAKLHNFCIENGSYYVPAAHDKDILPGDCFAADLGPSPLNDDEVGNVRAARSTRGRITEYLRTRGIYRPRNYSSKKEEVEEYY